MNKNKWMVVTSYYLDYVKIVNKFSNDLIVYYNTNKKNFNHILEMASKNVENHNKLIEQYDDI